MDKPVDGFGLTGVPPQAPDLVAALDAWRGILIDLPLSLGCLPQTLASDALHFAGRRLNAQADHLDELSRCRSLTEVARAQTAFAAQALSDYRTTAGLLLGDARAAVTALDEAEPAGGGSV